MACSAEMSEVFSRIESHYGQNKTINSKLQSLKTIFPTSKDAFEKKNIVLGIVHSNDVKAGLLTNALISDPFSSTPALPLVNEFRKSHPGKNLKVKSVEESESNEYLGNGIFKVKSPFLSAENRVLYDIKLGDGVATKLERFRPLFNDVSLVEINDLEYGPIDQVKNVEEISLSETNRTGEIKPNESQFMIYVTNDSSSVDILNDLPYTIVINNSNDPASNGLGSIRDATQSNDSTVNLRKVEEADDLISMDIRNVSEFIRLHRESNIDELLYGLVMSTSGYNVQIHMLRSLLRDLSTIEKNGNPEKLLNLNDDQIKSKLESELKHWSQNAHYNLQSTIEPYLDEVLLGKFSGILQLVVNSGDLSVVLSNILLEAEDDIKVKRGLIFGKVIDGHGSLKDQFGKAKYIAGRIDAIVPVVDSPKTEVSEHDSDESIAGIEKSVNKKLTNDILPKLQSKLNDILVQNLTLPPLVTCGVTTIGFLQDIISLNMGVSLTLFTVVLGAFKSQSAIMKAMKEAKSQWMSELKGAIERSNKYLWNKIGKNVAEKSSIDVERRKALEDLRLTLADITKINKELMENTNK